MQAIEEAVLLALTEVEQEHEGLPVLQLVQEHKSALVPAEVQSWDEQDSTQAEEQHQDGIVQGPEHLLQPDWSAFVELLLYLREVQLEHLLYLEEVQLEHLLKEYLEEHLELDQEQEQLQLGSSVLTSKFPEASVEQPAQELLV